MILLMLSCLTAVTFTGLKTYGAQGHGPLAAAGSVSVTPISMAFADRDEEEDDDDKYDHASREALPREHAEHSDRWRDHDQHEDDETEEYWEELHEFFANLMVGLIIIHLLGVVVESIIQEENLVKAMITGYKNRSSEIT